MLHHTDEAQGYIWKGEHNGNKLDLLIGRKVALVVNRDSAGFFVRHIGRLEKGKNHYTVIPDKTFGVYAYFLAENVTEIMDNRPNNTPSIIL